VEVHRVNIAGGRKIGLPGLGRIGSRAGPLSAVAWGSRGCSRAAGRPGPNDIKRRKILTETGKYDDELLKAGAASGRETAKRTVTDGPFAESKELIVGTAAKR
jgi:hypothetical protein